MSNKEILEVRDIIYPTRVVKVEGNVQGAERLLEKKKLVVTFHEKSVTTLCGDDNQNPYILLDFGKEICGGIRIIVCDGTQGGGRVRITFGESVTEAMSKIGENGSNNDHSPRDFEMPLPLMSDLQFGQTGFRFAKIELCDKRARLDIKSVVAVSVLQDFEKKGFVKTNDEELNTILETAVYTCHLNMQNGVIWDGIKRDRLVWAGDLNSQILTASYVFGGVENIKNSLQILKDSTPGLQWINNIPSYSAWWIINYCDYYLRSGDENFWKDNLGYVKNLLEKFSTCITQDGKLDFSLRDEEVPQMQYYLDWPTYMTEDAEIGTAFLILFAMQKMRKLSKDNCILALCEKLESGLSFYKNTECAFKQTKALQVLIGGDNKQAKIFLEKDDAYGFSTFMAYYILSALDCVGSKITCKLIKDYYGGMIARGATTFWEDFDLSWLENSGRIDEETPSGKKDLHRDFGRFCYEGVRLSLCHGWACGVFAFVIEKILGLEILDAGYKTIRINPNLFELKYIQADIPTPFGLLKIKADEFGVKTEVPNGITLLK